MALVPIKQYQYSIPTSNFQDDYNLKTSFVSYISSQLLRSNGDINTKIDINYLSSAYSSFAGLNKTVRKTSLSL